MKTKLKKNFTAILALAFLSLVIATPIFAQVSPSLRVTGEATLTVDADMAVLRFGITQQAKTPAAASQAVMVLADKTINALVALGIEKKLISTGYFGIYPVYDDRQGKQNDVVGYRADTTITLTIKEVSLVGQAVDTALGAGITEVRGVSYGKKDEESLKNEVLRLSVANALKKAEVLTQALGRKLGPALTVEEQGYSMSAPESRAYMSKAMVGGAPDAFAPGSIEVRASVSILFSMD